jgi:vitamin B12 transporter
MLISLLLATAAVAPVDLNNADSQAQISGQRLAPLTVTASREPVPVALSGTALTIINRDTIEALSLPLISDYLALSPSVAVATTGALGNQTQIRIRGAEANQTLTLIDGIDVTDPASSGEFRYETLLSDGIERIEVLRGPQSALWGSQAIGGVINILTRDAPMAGAALYGQAEGGSLGTVRAGVGGGYGFGTTGITAQASYLRSDGYDVSGTGGDRDGYENFSFHGKLRTETSATSHLAVVGRYVASNSRFDGNIGRDGRPADRALATQINQFALRGEAGIDLFDDHWQQLVAGVYTGSANINRNADVFQNRADGGRFRFIYQSNFNFTTGTARHRLTAAVEHDRERFSTSDDIFGGFTDQTASRLKTSLIGEYRLDYADWFGGGIAVRHDYNNRFADATTVRATAAARLGGGFALHASYGEGAVAPTFTEQFGFFPGSFIGNPNVVPERSRGGDIGGSWTRDAFDVDITWFRANLTNEIISTFNRDFTSSVANTTGRSTRSGLEISAAVRPFDGVRLAATYAYLDASDQQLAAGLVSREIRRPKHSGSVTASYADRRFDLAASAAITGARNDNDFSSFPSRRVALPEYTRLTVTGAWHLSPQIDLTGRLENALDTRNQDVFGYRSAGLTAHAGVRLRL